MMVRETRKYTMAPAPSSVPTIRRVWVGGINQYCSPRNARNMERIEGPNPQNQAEKTIAGRTARYGTKLPIIGSSTPRRKRKRMVTRNAAVYRSSLLLNHSWVGLFIAPAFAYVVCERAVLWKSDGWKKYRRR